MRTTRNLQALLRAADPVSREPGLSQAETARMRQTVLRTQGEGRPVRAVGFRMSAAGALAALLLVAVMLLNLQISSNRPPGGTQKALVNPEEIVERRQVQFATPGGTRIIWTLNPEFKMGGLAP